MPTSPSTPNTVALEVPAVFDLDAAVDLIDEISARLETTDRLMVDLSKVEYMNLAGATVLLWAHRRLRCQGGELTLIAMSPQARSVLSVNHVLDEFADRPSIPRQSAGPPTE